MSDRIDLQEFVGGFVVEAEELLAIARAALRDIETGLATRSFRPRSVRELFRVLHTIKGLAAMIEREPVVELAHACETLVKSADRAGGRIQAASLDLVVQAVEAIASRVRAIAEGRTVAAAPESLLQQMAVADHQQVEAEPIPAFATGWEERLSPGERQHLVQSLRAGRSAWSLWFRPSEQLSALGVSIATVRARLGELAEIIKVVPKAASGDGAGVVFEILVVGEADVAPLAEAAMMPLDQARAIKLPDELRRVAPEPDEEGERAPGIGTSVVRVELARLDELQEHLSSLVVSRFQLERVIATEHEAGRNTRRLREISDTMVRQLRDLRRAVLRARLVRLSDVFEPLSLVVRSLVRMGTREAQLVQHVGALEVDKAVADRLFPAIVHLVRNAVDHGIEPVADRLAAGKPRAGTITIAAGDAAGGQIRITIEDDGRGIDRDAVAVRAGREVSEDEALLAVLTTPGFSTRDTATDTSGRGLGLDIVHQAASSLRGRLGVASRRGAGTRFTLDIPLTVAILDVFSFECADRRFVVPVSAVDEVLELPAATEPPRAQGRIAVFLVERRGRALPVIPFASVLQLGRSTVQDKALVVRRRDEPVAFSVDRIIGRHEVVVRAVDDPLVRMPGIAGATDLGEGHPTLVLDLVALADALHVEKPT